MRAIQEFENAPVGAIATSRDGLEIYRRETKTLGGEDWIYEGGNAAHWTSDADLAHFGYTLCPAPSPAPTTVQEALDGWLGGVSDEYDTALGQWLDEVRAKAWEEGHEAAAMRVPEGVWHDTASPRTPNPYRKEKDQ